MSLRPVPTFVFLLTGTLAAVCGIPSPAEATPFANEAVRDRVLGFSSVALDGAGNPRISYAGAGGSLFYASKDGGDWTFQEVDVVDVGRSSLALASDGTPHIAYNDADGDDLDYAYWDEMAGWILETVDSGGIFDAGVFNSLKLDASGVPHVAYTLGNDLRYGVRTGGTWSVETVDVGGNYDNVSLALDSMGNPRISYSDAVSGDLKYAAKNGGMWDIEVVDTTSIFGSSSLALDADDVPHIAYYDGFNGNLMYAKGPVQNVWETTIIDAAGTVGFTPSIGLTPQGDPRIAYHDETNGNLKYAVQTSGLWSTEVVDAGVDVGRYTSMAMDDLGHPHISYYDSDNADLKYADAYVTLSFPTGGERWSAGSRQTVRWIGLGAVSIAISMDGGASYQTVLPLATGESATITVPDWTTAAARVRLTLLAEPTFVSDSPGFFSIGPFVTPYLFVSEAVDTLGNVAARSRLVLDENGDPEICFRPADGNLRYAVRSGDGTWLVDLVGISGIMGGMKRDHRGVTHLTAWSILDEDLLYATRSPAGLWTVEAVDTVGSVGNANSLDVDSQGNPHISYYDLTNGDLKYATKADGIWSIATLDSTGDVGSHNSIALNRQGLPRIAYRDETNTRLMLISRTDDFWGGSVPVDESGDVGTHVSLAIDDADIPHICYADVDNGGLRHAWMPGNWVIEEIDRADFGPIESPTLRLDAEGHPHVVYEVIFDGVKYARREPGGGWASGFVAGEFGSGIASSFSLDFQGQPRVCYSDLFAGEIMYASAAVHLTRPRGGERWAAGSRQTLEWGGKGTVSVELSTDGGFTYIPILSGITSNTVSLTVPRVTTNDARVRIVREASYSSSESRGSFAIAPGLVSPWWTTTPDTVAQGGLSPSLALNDLGSPAISHSDGNNLRFVEREGATWTVEVADTIPDAGYTSSLAFDTGGDPHISHAEATSGLLRYTRRVSGSWISETVDPGPGVGLFSSLALDSGGNPVISYYDVLNLTLKVARKNGSWALVTADNSGTVGFAPTSLALDSRDRAYVAYYDQINTLKLAVDDGAGNFTTEIVDEVGDPGSYASLALDEEEVPHVAYYAETPGDLRYAVKRDGEWRVETVDAPGDVGSYTSLALDEAGNPIIAYYEATGERLKVARRVGGSWTAEFVGNPMSGYGASIVLDADGNPRVAYQDYANDLLQYSSSAIEVSNPSPDETWPVGATRTVRWDGTGRVNVLLSVDGGNSFQTLAEGVSGGSHGLVVPHQPSSFSQIKVERAVPKSRSTTPGLFTVETDIVLLSLSAGPPEFELTAGAVIAWRTDPGPEDLAGYRLEKQELRGSWTTVAHLISETSYHDREAIPGTEYRLFGVNGLGEELLLGRTTFGTLRPLSAGPLPYRGGSLRIQFATFGGLGGGPGGAEVALFDLQGRRVRVLASGSYPAGLQKIDWDGRDEAGRRVGSGVYFLRSITAGESHRLKIVVVR